MNILIVRDFIQSISMTQVNENEKTIKSNNNNLGSSGLNFSGIEKLKLSA
ncbi:MAG: hypothetical protein WCL02_02360 [bacterium]